MTTILYNPQITNLDALDREFQRHLQGSTEGQTTAAEIERALLAEECAELRRRLAAVEKWQQTPDLALSCNLDTGTISFGALPFAIVGEEDSEWKREAGVAIYNQLVDLQREIWTLRRWKQRTDEWLQQRPPD